MSPDVRRLQLLEVISQRRHDTCENLAREFNVSKRTIYSDVQWLMCSYPIETVCGRYGGGVRVVGDFYFNRKTLSPQQTELLKELGSQLEGSELNTINSILLQFAL